MHQRSALIHWSALLTLAGRPLGVNGRINGGANRIGTLSGVKLGAAGGSKGDTESGGAALNG